MAGVEPCMLTLTEASRSIRAGKLSPAELTRSCLAMIDRFEPQVKAWVTLDRDGALREAAWLEDERRAMKSVCCACNDNSLVTSF